MESKTSSVQLLAILFFSPVSTQHVLLRALYDVVWKRQSEKRTFLIKSNAKSECFASESGVKNSSSHENKSFQVQE